MLEISTTGRAPFIVQLESEWHIAQRGWCYSSLKPPNGKPSMGPAFARRQDGTIESIEIRDIESFAVHQWWTLPIGLLLDRRIDEKSVIYWNGELKK